VALKKQFNRIKYSDPDWQGTNGEPWLRTIHRDAHAQPFANLEKAWSRYFKQRRAGHETHLRDADHWYLAVQVDVPDHVAFLPRTRDGTTGVDLGVTTAATLSNGEKIEAPRPLSAALRRLRIRSRRQSRKLERSKATAGIEGSISKSTWLPASKNRMCGARALAGAHLDLRRLRCAP
jgi:putative transposase